MSRLCSITVKQFRIILLKYFHLGESTMTYEEIAAQVFVFYIAGSESSSSTVAYTMYELTQNERLMERAREDIKSTLAKHAGELSYESIMDMKFIDLCVKETLRKYPGLPILNRECTKSYQIPGSEFTIEKGTSVIVSLLGIHRDARFFPEPEKYNPDRFSDATRAYDEDMYMPFGAGPRNCIGEFVSQRKRCQTHSSTSFFFHSLPNGTARVKSGDCDAAHELRL